jgi:hypothetical protein
MKLCTVKASDRSRIESWAKPRRQKLRPLDEIIDHLFSWSEGDRAVCALFRMDITAKSLHLLASSPAKWPIAGPSGNFSAIA